MPVCGKQQVLGEDAGRRESGMARLIIQSDWDQVLREATGTAWVSCRIPGQPTVYGDLKTYYISSDGNPYLTAPEGFTVEEVKPKTLSLSFENGLGSCAYRFLAPVTTFSSLHKAKKSVGCVDVSTGGLAVSCDTDGKLKVWTTDTGEIRRDLEGHFGDIYTCRIFPSGIVVLSGGADTQLKIWSVETGQSAATLLGHTAGVTDTAIVDRGRNVVSCSRDGTVKLWDCGMSKCLGSIDEIGGGMLNACALEASDPSVDLGQPSESPSEREVSTEGKMLLLACENATLQAYGLQSRKKIFEVGCTDAVNCCAFLSDTTAICGTQDGHLHVIDIRNTSTPLKSLKESRSAFHSILPYRKGLFASTGDGSCFYLNEEFETKLELTGPDCDTVYKVVTDRKFVYTSSRDGHIRKYKVDREIL